MSNSVGEGDNFITFEIPFIRGIDINDRLCWTITEKIFSFSKKTVKKQ